MKIRLLLIFILSLASTIAWSKSALCQKEKSLFKQAKSKAKKDCKGEKGKEKRACKYEIIHGPKAEYKKCRKESKGLRKKLKCEQKIKKKKNYKWDEKKGRCLKLKKSSCNKLQKLIDRSKLKNSDKWKKLIDGGSCTKMDYKEAKCESKGKQWIEKRKGRFKCIKKSKVMQIKAVKLAMDPKKDKVKFMKCKKYWTKIRKRISGQFIKVKHYKKLVKKGCIAPK